jgi:hypothetical protein
MPNLRQETFGPGDQSWLGSTHGIRESRTVIIDISTFTPATHYPDGFIKSGFPIAIVGGVGVPYDITPGTVAGAGILAGHLLTDQRVYGTADFGAPLLDHGRVKVAKIATILAGFVKPLAAKNATTIVHI